jgi:hypothetical protein
VQVWDTVQAAMRHVVPGFGQSVSGFVHTAPVLVLVVVVELVVVELVLVVVVDPPPADVVELVLVVVVEPPPTDVVELPPADVVAPPPTDVVEPPPADVAALLVDFPDEDELVPPVPGNRSVEWEPQPRWGIAPRTNRDRPTKAIRRTFRPPEAWAGEKDWEDPIMDPSAHPLRDRSAATRSRRTKAIPSAASVARYQGTSPTTS